MLISIIVPAYNCEATIIRCLESLSKQTYEELEIVVVDDGSDDQTLNVVRKYSLKDERVRIFTKKNCGPGSARNVGLGVILGEYFTFVDADDTVKPTYIESMVSSAELNRLDLIICKLQTKETINKKKSGQISIVSGEREVLNSVISLIQEGLFNSPFCKLYKTAIQKKYEIFMPVQIDIGEDLQFNLSYVQHIGTIGILDLCLYNYHIEDSRLTKKYRKFEYDVRVGNIRNLEKFIKENDIPEEQFIYYLYLKLMYAECISMYGHVKKDVYFKRIGVLLDKDEIKASIRKFDPKGILQKIMYWGCKTYNIKRIHRVVIILKTGKKIVPRIKRASV